MISHLLLLCFVIFVQSSSVDKKCVCEYGVLTPTTATWGLDIYGKKISGSLMVALNGSECIKNINKLYRNFNPFVGCLMTSIRNATIINDNDCNYGLLNNGVVARGTDEYGKSITGVIISDNGSDSINAFTRLMNENKNVIQIRFQPRPYFKPVHKHNH